MPAADFERRLLADGTHKPVLTYDKAG